MKAAHDFDVQRLQRVASWLNEVDTRMHTVVDNVHTVDLVLGFEVGIKSLLNILDDGTPRIIVVDEVSEAWCINDCQSESDAVLFNVCADRLDGDRLRDDVETGSFALARRVEGGVEESVDEGRLAEAGFACSLSVSNTLKWLDLRHTDYHDVEVEALANTLAVPLVGQIGKADVASQLPTNDIAHVTGCGSCSFGVFRRDRLGNARAMRVALADEGRGRLAIGDRRRGCFR